MTASDSPSIDERIAGSFRQRFFSELFRNSGHFPAANLLLEVLSEGVATLRAPDVYVLVAAALAQSWALVARPALAPLHRLLGNLVGPVLYTAAELALEGPQVLFQAHHLAYWAFALTIGALQALRARGMRPVGDALAVVAENVARAAIVFVMYAIFEAMTEPGAFALARFFADPAHVFIALAVLLLGVATGLAALAEEGYLRLLRATSARLKGYSEWLFGAELLERAIADPSALALARRERSVLFVDIRGFTAWSERCAPEAVVEALNEYYGAAEPVLRAHRAIKLKHSADEILAVFAEPNDALECARGLRNAVAPVLGARGLGAGIGVHRGALVEGLIGSPGAKGYDVIGDTVNTAKRIEGAAAAGEILVSEALREAVAERNALGPRRDISVKGKEAALAVYPLV